MRAALANSPLGPVVRALRRVATMAAYLVRRSGPPPHRWKQRHLARLLRRHRLDYFVETGTHLGDTIAYLGPMFAKGWTVEIDDDLHRRAVERFAYDDHIVVLHGDSAQILPTILRDLPGPALFWLDGHFSGEGTGRGDTDTPVNAELAAILADRRPHVIVIDDVREFGTGDYPTLAQVKSMVPRSHLVDVTNDMLTVTPRGSDWKADAEREDSRQGGVGRR